LECPIELRDIVQISQQLSDDVDDYKHSMLQTAIAGIAISQSSDFTIVVSPTGSGKTWIQALIAKHYCL
jgi:superfamily II DNA or RNA helicase